MFNSLVISKSFSNELLEKLREQSLGEQQFRIPVQYASEYPAGISKVKKEPGL